MLRFRFQHIPYCFLRNKVFILYTSHDWILGPLAMCQIKLESFYHTDLGNLFLFPFILFIYLFLVRQALMFSCLFMQSLRRGVMKLKA